MNVVRHVVVRGRVQGVGYRAFVEHEAARLRIAGWVRNRRDGAVEALFVGEAEAVAGMIEACRQGLRGGRVDGIEVGEGSAAELTLAGQGGAFAVLPTA